MRRVTDIFILCMLLVAVSCNRTPSYVIDTDDMSKLLADLHIAESVVDMNHSDYLTDSTKIALRQAVFEKHGVTAEQFDTSMVWYGSHMEVFLDVYDDVIKILDEKERALSSSIVQASISVSGDSVDVWSGARYSVFSRRMPSDMISFEIKSDENWEPGDMYTWRTKVIDDGIRSIKWNILANYSDSTCEWLNSTTSNRGWNEVVFVADSAKTLTNIRGILEVVKAAPTEDIHGKYSSADTELWIDSISLVRKRCNPELYYQRSRLRTYRTY